MDKRRELLKEIKANEKARKKAKRKPVKQIFTEAIEEVTGNVTGMMGSIPEIKERVERAKRGFAHYKEHAPAFSETLKKDAEHYFHSRWKWNSEIEGLGDLYDGNYRSFNRREWKGFRDTMYDFGAWCRLIATLLVKTGPYMPSMALALFRYPWMSAYVTSINFCDRHKLGLKGNQLRYTEMQFYCMIKDTLWSLTKFLERDLNLHPWSPRAERLRSTTIMFDEMNPVSIMMGFPDLEWQDIMAISVAMPGEIDQSGNLYQIDISQRQGMAADVCPFPSAEVGAGILNDLPITGSSYITSSMPCDGAVGATMFMSRHFNEIPRFVLSPVQRFNTPENSDFTVADLKECIDWIENLYGVKWDWDYFWERAREYNLTTETFLEKLDINATPYPQVCGGGLALQREVEVQLAGTLDHFMTETDVMINEKMLKEYEKDKAKNNIEYKYRSIVWCCPAHYYTNFTTWAEATWGMRTIMDMESMLSYHFYNIGDEEQALYDIAHTYERMMMRSHSNGGYVNALDECWRMCEKMNANIVIMYDHVGCKNFGGLHGLFEDQARERGIHLIWVQHDLLDPRVVSRKAMRDSVNKYMTNVFRAEPVDPTFVDYEDALTW